MTLGVHLARWDLVPDGEPITTPSSLLLPVRHNGVSAMLKIAREDEERRGGALMAWWDGDGAARVLAQHGPALLLERANGPRSLAAMVAAGEDDEASRILCEVTMRLHVPRAGPPPELVPLARWFEALAPAARTHGGLLAQADSAAQALLADPRDVVVLHGDIHHGNVLDGGERGWLAIDPKALLGERTFDFVNILRNPDAATALMPGRFDRQVEVLAAAASIERRRLLEWTLAFAGLSAAWHLADGTPADLDLAVADLALIR
ncbi:MAG: APH(6) family putative aminoglycoside O-phosphotransferase [Rhodospirillales bacterium]|nr:APH(6) family putative aminoglycoside O-phosphotransferase [Rhodospirillales bacterium]